eukprot:COSAG01_NODE_899_length_12871_cov_27.629572_11_plen_106_part_00
MQTGGEGTRVIWFHAPTGHRESQARSTPPHSQPTTDPFLSDAQGLQHAAHGYCLAWSQSFLEPLLPIPSYHFWIAVLTRSPSIRIEFQAPQWWWQLSRKAPDSLL